MYIKSHLFVKTTFFHWKLLSLKFIKRMCLPIAKKLYPRDIIIWYLTYCEKKSWTALRAVFTPILLFNLKPRSSFSNFIWNKGSQPRFRHFRELSYLSRAQFKANYFKWVKALRWNFTKKFNKMFDKPFTLLKRKPADDKKSIKTFFNVGL